MLSRSNLESNEWDVPIAVAFGYFSERSFCGAFVVPDAVRITHVVHLTVAPTGGVESQALANRHQFTHTFAMIHGFIRSSNLDDFYNILHHAQQKQDQDP